MVAMSEHNLKKTAAKSLIIGALLFVLTIPSLFPGFAGPIIPWMYDNAERTWWSLTLGIGVAIVAFLFLLIGVISLVLNRLNQKITKYVAETAQEARQEAAEELGKMAADAEQAGSTYRLDEETGVLTVTHEDGTTTAVRPNCEYRFPGLERQDEPALLFTVERPRGGAGELEKVDSKSYASFTELHKAFDPEKTAYDLMEHVWDTYKAEVAGTIR